MKPTEFYSWDSKIRPGNPDTEYGRLIAFAKRSDAQRVQSGSPEGWADRILTFRVEENPGFESAVWAVVTSDSVLVRNGKLELYTRRNKAVESLREYEAIQGGQGSVEPVRVHLVGSSDFKEGKTMKISVKQLRKIIKEEVLKESGNGTYYVVVQTNEYDETRKTKKFKTIDGVKNFIKREHYETSFEPWEEYIEYKPDAEQKLSKLDQLDASGEPLYLDFSGSGFEYEITVQELGNKIRPGSHYVVVQTWNDGYDEYQKVKMFKTANGVKNFIKREVDSWKRFVADNPGVEQKLNKVDQLDAGGEPLYLETGNIGYEITVQ